VPKLISSVVILAGFGAVLTAYHFLFVEPQIRMAAAERGAYIMDVESLTAFKAAQLVKEYQEGKVDLSTPESMQLVMEEFRADIRRILKETVGNAPVFQPKAVVSGDGFIDLTPLVAGRLNINFQTNYLTGTSDGGPVPGSPTE
jgi:hypothetical protein